MVAVAGQALHPAIENPGCRSDQGRTLPVPAAAAPGVNPAVVSAPSVASQVDVTGPVIYFLAAVPLLHSPSSRRRAAWGG